MLVDGVVVVHVELHLRDDAAEIGHEAAEHARPRSSSAAPARDRAARSARRGTARWRAGRRGTSSISLASRAAARIASGWISSPCAVGEREQLDQAHRIFGEEVVARERQPAAIEHEAVEPARAPPERRQPEAASRARRTARRDARGTRRSGRRPSSPAGSRYCMNRSTADLPGRSAKRIRVGDLALDVEGQPVLGAAGDEVEVAAHRPQEIVGAVEPAIFGRGEQPGVDQLARRAGRRRRICRSRTARGGRAGRPCPP